MNYNLIAYSIYVPIIGFIMIKIGWLFYTYGEIYLLHLYHNNQELVNSINKLLLISYHLLNLGYAIISIAYWEKLTNLTEVFSSISQHLGIIIIGLAVMHYNNIFILNYLVKTNTLKH